MLMYILSEKNWEQRSEQRRTGLESKHQCFHDVPWAAFRLTRTEALRMYFCGKGECLTRYCWRISLGRAKARQLCELGNGMGKPTWQG